MTAEHQCGEQCVCRRHTEPVRYEYEDWYGQHQCPRESEHGPITMYDADPTLCKREQFSEEQVRLKTIHRHARQETEADKHSRTLCGLPCDTGRVSLCALPADQRKPISDDKRWCGRCDAVAATLARRPQDQHSAKGETR